MDDSQIREHLPYLKEVCLTLKPKLILELGVENGPSTKAFLKAIEGTEVKLISIDKCDCSEVSDSANWQFIQMNDLDFKLKKRIDILFIDTSHTYKQTLAELQKFAPTEQTTMDWGY